MCDVRGKHLSHAHISPTCPRLINIIRTGYVADDFEQLFERAGNNVHTINVRILWEDAIFTRDPDVIKYVLATGFSDFDKGKELKLRYVL